MKRFLGFLGMLIGLTALCVESERVSITVGATKTIENPFIVETYRLVPSGRNCVSVEVNDSQIQLIGNSIGDVNLIVKGGGLQKDYSISVKSNLSVILKKLRNDLAALTELDIAINEDKIVLRGTVTNPEHWAFLQKVLPAYSQYCQDLTKFTLSGETLTQLKKNLEGSGYKFTPPDTKPNVGEIQFRNTNDTVIVSGEMYSKNSIEEINRVLDNTSYFSSGWVKKVVNLNLVPTILEIDVAFLTLDDNDGFTRTGNMNPTLGFDASFLRRWLDNNTREKTVAFQGDMGGTISLLQENFVSKMVDQGSLAFANDAPEGGQYKFGGTVNVPVSGLNSGDLKEIEYGYDVKIKGGLVTERAARLELEIISSYITNDEKGNYDLKRNEARLTLPFDLDKTYIIAHHKGGTELQGESGFPILSRIPVVKWLFSDSTETKSEKDILILVSVRAHTRNGQPVMEMNSDQVVAKMIVGGENSGSTIGEDIKDDFKKIVR